MKYKFTALLRVHGLGYLDGQIVTWQRCLQSWLAFVLVLGTVLSSPQVFAQQASGVASQPVSNQPVASQAISSQAISNQPVSNQPVSGSAVTSNKVNGQTLIRDAVRVMSEHRTIQARLRVRTDLLGQPLIGSGSYAQLASNVGPLLRLELAIQAGEQATSVKQVSDGSVMWESWRIGGSTKLNRIDLRRARQR